MSSLYQRVETGEMGDKKSLKELPTSAVLLWYCAELKGTLARSVARLRAFNCLWKI